MSTPNISEIRRRLQEFSKEHENDADEKQHAQQFWRDFYMCFGLSKSSASMFEARVLKVGGVRGYIDSFIPGVLLVEQKSLGRNLNDAYIQAQAYFHAITNEFEKPKYIITCDFQTFHLYNLQNNAKEPLVCKLSELSQCADWFMFLVEKEVHAVTEELPVNRKAAEQIAKLHDALLRANYKGKDLEIFLTRLLFCLFADDTGIFGDDGQFKKLVEKSKEDGSDLGSNITLLFQVLNTAKENRQTNLDDSLKAFEYVNGSLFEEQIQIPYFNFDLRTILLKCVQLDWSGISPAIFGAMFQAVLEDGATDTAHRKESRRELGAHYTSERNILKVIEPLFLNELQDEFVKAKGSESKLLALYEKLPTLKFFDPACGCGNFLVIAYREIRRVENDVISELLKINEDKKKNNFKGGLLDIATLCRVNIGQFYGIEIDGAAAHIARVAMYITDHQLNLDSANKFGKTRATVPLVTTPHIHYANALRIDWNDVIKAEECSFVFGNPPFIGKKMQSKEQKEELLNAFEKIKNASDLDYVACWYIKASYYIKHNPNIEVAFVSTNSITQGEQTAILWGALAKHNVVINFAYRTFVWTNEGRGIAAVHCVIIGFGLRDRKKKLIYTIDEKKDIVTSLIANQINLYLVDAPLISITARSKPICNVNPIVFGNMANDGGNYLFTTEQKDGFIKKEPNSAIYFRKFLGATEFINNIDRWCLWLKDVEPQVLRGMPAVFERVSNVKNLRLSSTAEPTRDAANRANEFFFTSQPDNGSYILIPRHSSENRDYIPIGFLSSDVICGDANCLINNATLNEFAVLTSKMHMAWVRVICGRIKSDFRYSNTIVYNNYIWNIGGGEETIANLNRTAQGILDARNVYPNASLADLYDKVTMPIELVKAHDANNKAVDKAYGYVGADDDASRVAFLFKKYEELTSLLPPTETKKKRVKKIADSDMFN
jgi:type I restriction-modification system DNA methylase subunit